jgi:transposase, IS6 family
VREQFLVEVEVRGGAADLAELNRLFASWVEGVYHQRVHTETGTVSLHGNRYQVDPALAGHQVELVFDPFDLERDETYVKVAGRWRYVYRAIDQFGQVIDIFVSSRRNATAARSFFQQAIKTTKVTPVEVVTDKAATYPIVLDELLPTVWHHTEQYANNHIEADHGRLKARLRPMRGFQQDRSARVVIAGHGFMQNVRRGHYELAVETPANRRVAAAFDELATAI